MNDDKVEEKRAGPSRQSFRANEPSYRVQDELVAARPVPVDHEERARKRLAELRAQIGDDFGSDVFIDKFYAVAPPGWSYNWKRFSTWNKEDPQYLASQARFGWSPVPAHRHRELLFPEYADESIIIDGLILMERPQELTDLRKKLDYESAVSQVTMKEASMADAPEGTAPRNHPEVRPRISTQIGPPIGVPE